MADAGPRLPDRHLFIDFVIRIEQGVDGAVANGVGGKLQVVFDRGFCDRDESFLGDEENAAIFRIVDRVDFAHAPGLSQIRAAGQHTAVEERLAAEVKEPEAG